MLIKELEELFEEEEYFDYEIFEEVPEEYRLSIEERIIYIPRYEIKIRSGIYESWNSQQGDYETDFNFYMFFDALSNEHLGEEGRSSLIVSLYNYLSKVKQQILTNNELENLECKVL